MSYHFFCNRGIRLARTEQFLVLIVWSLQCVGRAEGGGTVDIESHDGYRYTRSSYNYCALPCPKQPYRFSAVERDLSISHTMPAVTGTVMYSSWVQSM